MALPRAIQRQADEAAAAEAAFMQPGQQPEVVMTDPSQLAPVNEPMSEPSQIVDAPPPTPTTSADDGWEQKYKSVRGHWAQTTAELQAQNRQYESQMAQMQKQVDALMQMRKQDDVREKQSADPKDVENFGADLIEMVKRYAEQTFQSMSDQFSGKAAELDGRLGALEQQVTGVSNRANTTLEQQFYATLNTLTPDWEETNQDKRWLSWLAETDPVYGSARQAALDNAHQQMDVQRVANVFKAFKSAHPVKPQSSMANQVAPNGAANPVLESPQPKPILGSKFIEKFYGDMAKGRYAGREAEANQIEAEINLAAAEGRIR